MPLSAHVYCVAITFKMTEPVEQWICIKFCVKLEHSSTETNQMIQKPAAIGNCWLAASSLQCAHSASRLVQRFVVKHPITQMTQPPYSPDLVPSDFWLFLKLKLPLKGKRFQAIDEIQENTTGQLMANARTMWGPRCLLWREVRRHCPVYNVSCILYHFQ